MEWCFFFFAARNNRRVARCKSPPMLRAWPEIQLRMGIHSGPVNQVVDVNDQLEYRGRGDKRRATGDGLWRRRPHPTFQAYGRRPRAISGLASLTSRDLGEFEVKHGVRLADLLISIKDGLGNSAVPAKFGRPAHARPFLWTNPLRPPRFYRSFGVSLVCRILLGRRGHSERNSITPSHNAASPLPEKSICYSSLRKPERG